MFAVAVFLSVVGLLVGPAVMSWTRGSRATFAAFDGATLGIVPGLVLLRLLPHLLEETGAWAIGACALGYLAFSELEARAHGLATEIGIAIVLPALAIHGFLDGAGLALAFQRSDALGAGGLAAGAALVLHKVPEGLFVASILLPTLGRAKTAVRILALAASTVLGAVSGSQFLEHTSDRALHVAVALGLGVMLRMAVHRHGPAPAAGGERVASGLAFVASLALLLVTPDPQQVLMRAQPGELTALEALAPLLLETAPWLLAALLVGEWVAYRRRAANAVQDPQAGMWLPMVATSLPLLGVFFTVVRALVEPLCDSVRGTWASAAPRANLVLPSYLVGVVLSVAIEAAVPGDGLDRGWGTFACVMALALAFRMGAAGATVVAALLAHKGLALPAVLVFTGVAAHAASVARHGWVPATSARALVVVCASAGLVHLVGPADAPSLHGLAVHPHPIVEWLAGAAILGWALVQLVIAGPRAWFSDAYAQR